jgi:adenylyl-sulfate kinase
MTHTQAFKTAPRPCVIWFTGLSGAGKSTLSHLLGEYLQTRGYLSKLLDGDQLRKGLCADLGYSMEDREENNRRLGAVARLFCDSGFIVLVAAISPLRASRQRIRDNLGEGTFIEVFVDTPLAVCESRDPKGLYRSARRGDIKEFTGIDSVYEAPEHPEIRIDTSLESSAQCLARLTHYLRAGGYIHTQD